MALVAIWQAGRKTLAFDSFDLNQYHRVVDLTLRFEIAVVATDGDELELLMVRRDQSSEDRSLVLPGGYLNPGQRLEESVQKTLRVLNLGTPNIYQFKVFSRPDRDPRSRVVGVGYLAIVRSRRLDWCVREDYRFEKVALSNLTGLFNVMSMENQPIEIGLDHRHIIHEAVGYLQRNLDNSLIAFDCVEPSFTLLELQQVWEAITGKPHQKALFRKRMLGRILADGSRIVPTGDTQDSGGRPAKLYARQMPDPQAY